VKDKNPCQVHHDLSANSIFIELFQGECCEKELSRLSRINQRREGGHHAAWVGGKTIDTAKIAADRAGIPVIIVPTIASTDAPCSGCAILYSEDGVFDSVQYQKMNPQVVLVDTTLSPALRPAFLVSGMGDALATWFEARILRTETQSMNECGGYSTLAGLNLAKLCYDTLLMYGAAAKVPARGISSRRP